MKKKESHDIPVLFFNTGEEDREALFAILRSGILCEYRASAEEPTPLLLVGYQRFTGLKEIIKFISEQKVIR